MPAPTAIVWLRQDLRLAGNPALRAAAEAGGAVVPVVVWSPGEEGGWAPGAASRWWLHQSLAALDDTLRERGSRLVLRRGDVPAALVEIAAATGAAAAYWNDRWEPAAREQERAVAAALAERGIAAGRFGGSLLADPRALRNRQGRPYRVFTPFWKALQAELEPPAPPAAPRRLAPPPRWPRSEALADLGLLPDVDWAGGFGEAWQPGEAGAARRLRRFLDRALAAYPVDRDRPDVEGVSRLSPHLHFGEIGPAQVWYAVHRRTVADPSLAPAAEAFLRQLAWREFAHHLLAHFPSTPEDNLDARFDRFPWRRAPRDREAWRRGRTGFPIVDAGLRQLWATGWMHNRVRMITASLLVKHLLLDWRGGAAWFWDTLVDADLANNTLGWQWVAGCGADAAPYFRVFNPVRQGQRFDPEGAYVRRWVPELAALPARWIHAPWQAPPEALAGAGLRLGRDYPRPLVDPDVGRRRALDAHGRLRAAERSTP
ncbi:MAG: deoxyribodipyrimidine photo-lyase [Candidatus Krumholzibacteriota bacterium]|nr:deoxyribodipyrimidine photo-lyase [Candidatus Krumholzibacteriota bacterium]